MSIRPVPPPKPRLVPPPPHWERTEGQILTELPNVLGWELWQQVRHVRDWLETPPPQRSGLFPRHPSATATERALRALRAIEAEDVPLGAMSGPHPAHPALLNVHVWVGTYDGCGADRLRLELATEDDEAEDS